MNPIYTIMNPIKIPLGRIDKSINKAFIEDCKKHPNQDSSCKDGYVKACFNPKFMTHQNLHTVQEIQKKYIEPYLLNSLIDLYTDSFSNGIIVEKYKKNIEIQSMWLVEFDHKTHFKLHTHMSLPNMYSFSWYLKCEGNRTVVFMSDNKEYEISVSEGDLLFFPGWLPHRAEGANSICCSGNLKIEVE